MQPESPKKYVERTGRRACTECIALVFTCSSTDGLFKIKQSTFSNTHTQKKVSAAAFYVAVLSENLSKLQMKSLLYTLVYPFSLSLFFTHSC